jgi:hypothetical protein
MATWAWKMLKLYAGGAKIARISPLFAGYRTVLVTKTKRLFVLFAAMHRRIETEGMRVHD